MSCILLIDLQNDFNKIITPMMINSIKKLCKNTSIPVFWIYSNYFESESNSDPFSMTHEGKKKLCIKDTDGVKFSNYFNDIDKIEIQKKHYSAFYNTNLEEILIKNKITDIYLGGVTISCCIQKTAEHAKHIGFNVYLLSDCSNGFSNKKYGFQWFVENCKLATHYDVITNKPLILYYVNGSIPSWRVLMLMNYLNIHYKINRLKVMSGETKKPEFLKINKRGLTPTVIDDGLILTESHAILQYLIKYYSNGNLISDSKEKYIKIMSIVFSSDDIRKKYSPLEIYFNKTITEKEIIKAYDAYLNVHAEYKMVEESLSTKYIADDILSLADFSFFPTLAYHIHRGFEIIKYPKLYDYYNMINKEHYAIFSCPTGWNKNGKINVFELALSEKLKLS
jgi:glutathione S-transferase/nicotinamidase-related amidase